MKHLKATIDLLEELVAFPTISSDSNLAMIDHLANRLEAASADVEIFCDDTGQKANLFATLGPQIDGGIMLAGHSDVVPAVGQNWTSDPFKLREQDAKLYARGACDMKGFIAACVALAPRFAMQDLSRPIHFAFTYDEEVGCFGAQSLVEVLQQRDTKPGIAIVGEPTSMRVIEGHKGCFEYTTRFSGLEGHGSEPEKGVNAVEYAARFITHLLDLKGQMPKRAPADCRFDPPWTTLSTGTIKGGIARNVIAGEAFVEWEMRPVQLSDAEFVKKDLNRYCKQELLPQMRSVYSGSTIETEIVSEVQGLHPATKNEARELVTELTGGNDTALVAFGTEAGLYQNLDMDVIVCGPGSIDQAHKPDEFVAIEQIENCVNMLQRLGNRLEAE